MSSLKSSFLSSLATDYNYFMVWISLPMEQKEAVYYCFFCLKKLGEQL
jgi:hypothetical protein